MRAPVLMFGALLLVAAPAATQEVDLGATVTGEIRGFFHEPQFTGQADTLQLSLTVEPYITIQSGSGAHRFALMPLFRLDQVDPERSLVDLREAYWHGIFGDTEVVIGADRIFWGVTESRHLVDIVNQTAHVENGKITEYRTTLNVAFVVEHHSHLVGAGLGTATKDF